MDVTASSLGTTAFLLFLLLFGAFLLPVLAFFGVGWWMTNRKGSVSPYTGEMLLLGEQVTFESVRRVQDFLHQYGDQYNPLFDISHSAVCRKTGRIFPDCVGTLGIVKLPRNYLKKRYPWGHLTPWTTLSTQQKENVYRIHGSLAEFNLEESKAKIRSFPEERGTTLYVDTKDYTLCGWHPVPDTELEVMVVQKPKKKS